jgi:5'-deoxynucleotidase YfbR-like HD superfamily hydrolase
MASTRKPEKPTFADIEKVMRELVLSLYGVERAVPLPLPAGRRWESDGEHSWSIALIACMLAPHIDTDLDIGKVCQFATVHDLTEAYAGDTSAFATDTEHNTKKDREAASLRKIAKDFAHLPWLVTTLEAYERQDTNEAKYVRSIDKIVPLFFDYLTEGMYYHENKHTIEDFKAFMERPREKAKAHAGAFEYHEEVMAALLSRPEFFHGGAVKK